MRTVSISIQLVSGKARNYCWVSMSDIQTDGWTDMIPVKDDNLHFTRSA